MVGQGEPDLFRLQESEAKEDALCCKIEVGSRLMNPVLTPTYLVSNGTICLTKAAVAEFEISPEISP